MLRHGMENVSVRCIRLFEVISESRFTLLEHDRMDITFLIILFVLIAVVAFALVLARLI